MADQGLLQDTVDLLKALIAIPSFSREETKAAVFFQQHLETWFPNAVISRIGNNLLTDIKGDKDGPTLLLCSHIDTVAVAPGWTRDPFGASMEGDRLYGLGANDAGASVVSMTAAARALGEHFAGRLLLGFVAEEEAGDHGFYAIESTLPRYDGAIFGEPTNMGMAATMRGAMQGIMRSHGKSCHASRPWQGRNASDTFVDDIKTLRAIDLKDNSPWKTATVEPTVIQGGKSFNQIPALIEARLDIRTTPEKNNDWIIEQFKKSGLDIEITINRRSPKNNDTSSLLYKALKKVTPTIADYIFYGGCDMSFSTAPSIVMGPGQSERSHAADEFIAVPEISAAINIYSRTLASFFGKS